MADSDEPRVVVEGLEDLIKRDLEKHRMLMQRRQEEVLVHRQTRSHLIKRKKHYRRLIGGGQYDDDALRRSMDMIAVDIRQISDKVTEAEKAIEHHAQIVDTLTAQLEEQEKGLAELRRYREDRASANRH